eukprot:748428-Hanusia_phi.AAC.6
MFHLVASDALILDCRGMKSGLYTDGRAYEAMIWNMLKKANLCEGFTMMSDIRGFIPHCHEYHQAIEAHHGKSVKSDLEVRVRDLVLEGDEEKAAQGVTGSDRPAPSPRLRAFQAAIPWYLAKASPPQYKALRESSDRTTPTILIHSRGGVECTQWKLPPVALLLGWVGVVEVTAEMVVEDQPK